MRIRCLILFVVSSLVAFSQSGIPPSMPLTYFLGRGGPWTYPQSVAVGPGGDIWVGGVATGNTLPVVNAYKRQYSPALCGQFLSWPDLFLSRLRSDGQGALFSTYLGGSGADNLAGMAVDGQGNAYLTGTTSSDTFPLNRDLPQQGDLGFRSFVVKMSPSGGLVYAAPLPGNTFPAAIVVDQQGAAYVGGTTLGEVAQIGGLGSRFRFAGYLGQNEIYGPALAAGADGSIYVSGIRRVVDQNGFGNEASFLLRLDDEGSVLQDDAIVAGAIAVRSPGSIVVATVGFSGIVNSPLSQQQQQQIETRAVLVSVVDYEAGVPDRPRLFGMVNAGDQPTHPLTPTTVVSIYGTNLGPASGVAAEPVDGRFPTALAGVRVFFGDRPAPLLYVSEGQINAVTPGDLGDHPLVPIRVERDGVSPNLLTMTTDSASPGMFITGPGAGPGAEPFVLAINADGTLNSPANPAQRGTAVSIFATGIGTYAPLLADGEIAPLEPPYPAAPDIAAVEVEFLPAQVTYAGAAPGVVTGVAQINFVIPPDGPFGNRHLYLKTPNGSAFGSVRLAIGP